MNDIAFLYLVLIVMGGVIVHLFMELSLLKTRLEIIAKANSILLDATQNNINRLRNLESEVVQISTLINK